MSTIAQPVKSRHRLMDELRREHESFRSFILPVLGPRVRVRADPREAEGWPHVPCRYGDLHWRGREWRTGEARIWVFTDRWRLISRLLAVPGVHRWQTGDREAAVWLAAEDTEAIRAVAQLLRPKVRRAPETGRSAEALAAARPRSDAPSGPQAG